MVRQTILVIEDEEKLRRVIGLNLSSAGFDVKAAGSAEEGFKLAGDVDLILTDLKLPGMDGLKATALLKGDNATRAIPVIALTALAMAGDEERIRAAGCDGYIAKPFAYREFLATIAAQLAQVADLARS